MDEQTSKLQAAEQMAEVLRLWLEYDAKPLPGKYDEAYKATRAALAAWDEVVAGDEFVSVQVGEMTGGTLSVSNEIGVVSVGTKIVGVKIGNLGG